MSDQEKTQEELISAAKAEMEAQRSAVGDLCKNADSPFWQGEFSNVSSAVSVFIIPAATDFDEFKVQAFRSTPSAAFVEYLYAPASFEYTEIFETIEVIKKAITGKSANDRVMELEERNRKLHESIKGNPVGIRLRLLFGNYCIEYSPTGLLSHLLKAGNIEYNQYEEEEGDPDEDDGFPDYTTAQLREYSLALANTMKIGMGRNIDQRFSITDEYLKTIGVKMRRVDVSNVAGVAHDLYEIKVLPDRVKAMEAEGKKAKEIAEELGCSLPKIRKILAAE